MFTKACHRPISRGRLFGKTVLVISFYFLQLLAPIPSTGAPARIDDGQLLDISAAQLKKSTQKKTEVQLQLGFGYRQDALNWNIAGNSQGNNPNVLSELTWDDLNINELRLGARLYYKQKFCLRGAIQYGFIVSGENQDSDYLEDDRQGEFSRSNNDAGSGNILDTEIGVGYALIFGSDFFSITPFGGYSYHQQNLRMRDGNQTITWEGGPPLGAFSDLDSTYDAEWKGFWIGLEPKIRLKKIYRYVNIFAIYASFSYHWLDYAAQADWNLRSDFEHPKSFEHTADGVGTTLSFGIQATVSNAWFLNVGYEQRRWSAASGRDRVFLVNGAVLETRLNEVNWESQVFKLEVGYKF